MSEQCVSECLTLIFLVHDQGNCKISWTAAFCYDMHLMEAT